jgi:molecular chaperone DnaK
MVNDAESHAEDDKEKRHSIEIRNHADSLVYTVEKTLRENAGAISPEDKAAVEAAVAGLKKAIEGTDISAIEAAMEMVNQSAHKMSEAMYAKAAAEQTGAAASDGASGDAEGEAPKGDAVDADFTVVDEEDKTEA